MDTPRLAHRTRQHVIIETPLLLGDAASSWHADALATWIRDFRRYSDLPVVCLSKALAALLALPESAGSRAASFGLAVLDDASDLAALEQTGATTALWVTSNPGRLIEASAQLRRAAGGGRLTRIDLTDDFETIDLDTAVVLGEEAFARTIPLHEAFELADRGEVWRVAGAKLEQELASRLVPILELDEADGQTFEAVVVLGVHHPAVRRVRLLREAFLARRQALDGPKPKPLPDSPARLRAWLQKEAKRRSKSLAVRLPFAEQLVAREYGATDFDELLRRAARGALSDDRRATP